MKRVTINAFFSGDATSFLLSIAGLLVITSFFLSAGDVYSVTMNKCIRPDGQVIFTDQPCPSHTFSSLIENKHSTQESSSATKNNQDEVPISLREEAKKIYISTAQQNNSHKISPRLIGGAIQAGGLNLQNLVTTIAGVPMVTGSADGTSRRALFNWPYGITSDGANLYVADYTNRCIRKIVIATGVVTTLAGKPRSIGSADGVGAEAAFRFIQGITTDGTNLYVTDVGNHNIRKIVISTGVVTTLAGSAENPGKADGIGTAATFNYPWGITTDGVNLYVTDDNNATIRQIEISTGVVTTLAGTVGFTGHTDGTGTTASFYNPYGITTDGTNLYVADSYNNAIRKIVISSGVVSTLAGMVGKYGNTDGVGTAATFYRPSGITTDGTNLYVADNWNSTIRKIVIATGIVSTLAGKAMIKGHDDGMGAAATLNSPFGITTDGKNLYVADTVNATIRKIQ